MVRIVKKIWMIEFSNIFKFFNRPNHIPLVARLHTRSTRGDTGPMGSPEGPTQTLSHRITFWLSFRRRNPPGTQSAREPQSNPIVRGNFFIFCFGRTQSWTVLPTGRSLWPQLWRRRRRQRAARRPRSRSGCVTSLSWLATRRQQTTALASECEWHIYVTQLADLSVLLFSKGALIWTTASPDQISAFTYPITHTIYLYALPRSRCHLCLRNLSLL